MIVLSDDAAIKRVLFHRDILEKVNNNVEYDLSEFDLPKSWVYLTETGDEVFILSDSDQIHVNILPSARGSAYFKCKRFIKWIFENTDLEQIFLKVHISHKNAIGLAKLCGFETVNTRNERELMRFKKCHL